MYYSIHIEQSHGGGPCVVMLNMRSAWFVCVLQAERPSAASARTSWQQRRAGTGGGGGARQPQHPAPRARRRRTLKEVRRANTSHS